MRIFASLHADIAEGFIWLEKPGLPPRSVVKVTSPGKDSVYCEALQFDQNFLNHYNQPPRHRIADRQSAVVMSGWYRARLGGLETQKDYALKIDLANGPYGKLRACWNHPQLVVRIATWLGVLSVVLGILGLALGVVSLCT
jgi:hypothetical protein